MLISKIKKVETKKEDKCQSKQHKLSKYNPQGFLPFNRQVHNTSKHLISSCRY